MEDSEKLAAIREILAQPYNPEYAVRAIREVLGIVDRPKWTDTGSGAGYDEGSPHDPRD